jgi:hypothetical protein
MDPSCSVVRGTSVSATRHSSKRIGVYLSRDKIVEIRIKLNEHLNVCGFFFSSFLCTLPSSFDYITKVIYLHYQGHLLASQRLLRWLNAIYSCLLLSVLFIFNIFFESTQPFCIKFIVMWGCWVRGHLMAIAPKGLKGKLEKLRKWSCSYSCIQN